MKSRYTVCLCTWRCSFCFPSISSAYSSFSLFISASLWSRSFLSLSALSVAWSASLSYTERGRGILFRLWLSSDAEIPHVQANTGVVCEMVLCCTLTNISKFKCSCSTLLTSSCKSCMRSCKLSKTCIKTHTHAAGKSYIRNISDAWTVWTVSTKKERTIHLQK